MSKAKTIQKINDFLGRPALTPVDEATIRNILGSGYPAWVKDLCSELAYSFVASKGKAVHAGRPASKSVDASEDARRPGSPKPDYAALIMAKMAKTV